MKQRNLLELYFQKPSSEQLSASNEKKRVPSRSRNSNGEGGRGLNLFQIQKEDEVFSEYLNSSANSPLNSC